MVIPLETLFLLGKIIEIKNKNKLNDDCTLLKQEQKKNTNSCKYIQN